MKGYRVSGGRIEEIDIPREAKYRYTKDGREVSFFLTEEAALANGRLFPPDFTGEIRLWYDSGRLHTISMRKDGKREGTHESFYENGNLRYRGEYREGMRNGPFQSFFEDGTPRESTNYEDDVER